MDISGKTAAYALPVIQCCVETLRRSSAAQTAIAQDKASLPRVKISEWDKDPMLSLLPDGLSTQSSSSKTWIGARATHGVKHPGKFYFEGTVIGSGVARLGWSASSASLELGKDVHGYGYGGTGIKSNNNKFESYGIKFSDQDNIGCCIDLDIGQVSFAVNGTHYGTAHTLPPTFASITYFPAFSIKGCDVKLNFGDATLRHPPPEGYSTLAQAPARSLISSDGVMESNGPRSPLALIIVPVKDLAEQVCRDILALSQYITQPRVSTVVLVGGDDAKKQQRRIAAGVDIIVCTPHKAADMVKRGLLSLQRVRVFVLDEADSLAADADTMAHVSYLYNSCPFGGTGDNRLQVEWGMMKLNDVVQVNMIMS